MKDVILTWLVEIVYRICATVVKSSQWSAVDNGTGHSKVQWKDNTVLTLCRGTVVQSLIAIRNLVIGKLRQRVFVWRRCNTRQTSFKTHQTFSLAPSLLHSCPGVTSAVYEYSYQCSSCSDRKNGWGHDGSERSIAFQDNVTGCYR